MGFDYSDGRRVEELILALLDHAPDLSSGARIGGGAQDQQWAVRYHLAPERANLLRHLDFSGLDVLELGAGMGGVSRFLAERCGHLTVVEGSSRRFQALASRLNDLDNWHGWFGRLEDFERDEGFDVLCVVGVLEYAERFITPPKGFEGDAYDYFLSRLRGLLKPDGVLLLAIENALGLKYWSGVAEDHTWKLFDGIVGYSDDPAGRTFSRHQLLTRLANSGWSMQREYFPFPDYKLPTTVIDGDLASADEELVADLACFQAFNDPQQPRSLLFSDYLAMQQIARAGLFADFANSFLLAASPQDDSAIFQQMTAGHHSSAGREVAWHLSTGRRLPVATRFVLSPLGHVEVEKSRLALGLEDSGPEDAGLGNSGLEAASIAGEMDSHEWTLDFGDDEQRLIWQGSPLQPVQVGERMRHRLLRALYFRRGERLIAELELYLRWARQQFGGAGNEDLEGRAVDALITNVVLGPDDEYLLFDQEWSLSGSMPLTWFVLRNVASLIQDHSMAHPELGFDDLGTLYRRLCEGLAIEPDLELDLKREALLQATVSGHAWEAIEAAISGMMRTPFSVVQPPRTADFAQAWDGHLKHLLEVRTDLETANSTFRQSISWLESRLHEEVQERSAERQALHGDLAQRDSAIASQQEAVEWLQQKVDEGKASHKALQEGYELLQTHTQSLDAQLREQSQHLEASQAELEFSRRRIEELYSCLDELTTILNSRSHRWTESLRRTYRRLRRVVGV